jgi:hypothetical protein
MMRHLDTEPEVLIARLNEERLLSTVIGKVALNSISGKKSQEVSF